jgi:hypothetical protein
MDLNVLLQVGKEWALGLWGLIINKPFELIFGIIAIVVGFKVVVGLFRFFHLVFFTTHQLVYLKVTLPREESQKDKEKI